jgi:Holliday junction resolvase
MNSGGSSNRRRGDYFERQTRAALEAVGWFVVRTAGSLGVADLVALQADFRPLLVSCKISGRIDPGEREALITAAEMAGARPIVASRPRGGWVDIGTLARGLTRAEPVDTLHVPRETFPRVAAVGDGLYPPGEQLTIDADD